LQVIDTSQAPVWLKGRTRVLIFRTVAILACGMGAAILLRGFGRVSADRVSMDNVLHVSVAGRDVALWKPGGAAPPTGYPVVVFSHGYTGCNTQSAFLMQALARAGYLVLAPNHKDAVCGTAWHPGKLLAERPQEPFVDASQWSDATYKDRDADVESVLDAVLGEPSFQGVPIDREHVGIAGHSLGGYTALGVAGGWRSWKDGRIKAVLALSPHCSPYIAKGDLGHLNVPVMYQGGSIDLGETPVVKRAGGAYDLSSAPKYFVELEGAGHLAWTDMNKRYQEVIDAYSVAFFDRYLKMTVPDPLVGLVSHPPAGVSLVKVDLK
jgi:predicted dienelactone hydrolase